MLYLNSLPTQILELGILISQYLELSRLVAVLDVAGPDAGHRQIVHFSAGSLQAPNWTRDGQALIYNTAGRLVRFDLASHTPEPIDTGDVVHNNNDHVLSFDGSRLAISSHDPETGVSRIYTLPVTGGQPTLVTPRGPSYLHGWSPDGRFLVLVFQKHIQLWEAGR